MPPRRPCVLIVIVVLVVLSKSFGMTQSSNIDRWPGICSC